MSGIFVLTVCCRYGVCFSGGCWGLVSIYASRIVDRSIQLVQLTQLVGISYFGRFGYKVANREHAENYSVLSNCFM